MLVGLVLMLMLAGCGDSADGGVSAGTGQATNVVAPPPAAPAAPAIEDPFAGKTFEEVALAGDTTNTSLIGGRLEFRTDGTLVVSYFLTPNAERVEPLQISDPVPYTMLEGQQFIVNPSSEHPLTVSYTPVPPDGFQMVWDTEGELGKPYSFVMRPFQPLEITPANLANTKWSIEPGGPPLSFDANGNLPAPRYEGDSCDYFWKLEPGEYPAIWCKWGETEEDVQRYMTIYSLSSHLMILVGADFLGVTPLYRVE
jgi:hypothetical protein